jgi:SagB-type dehydrogenase family enzyme
MTNRNIDEAPTFSLFWENSKLDKHSLEQLSKKLDEDAKTYKNIPQLFYPTEDLKLEKPDDELAKIFAKRESNRIFADYAITEKQLSSLFFSFSQKEKMTRVVPSAGGKYPVEVYTFLFNVKSKLNRKIVYYNSDYHSLSIVGDCGEWKDIKDDCGLWIDGNPSILFVFVGFADRVIDKYGERGGRFFMIEVGHYAQNLGLRIAQENLKGVEAGGLSDDRIKKYLKLERTKAMVALGFACGN